MNWVIEPLGHLAICDRAGNHPRREVEPQRGVRTKPRPKAWGHGAF